MYKHGKLVLNIGPMFSGKTTYLINFLTKMSDIRKKVLHINNILDTRQTTLVIDNITSHSGGLLGLPKSVKSMKVGSLSEIDDSIINEYDVIGVDEANFYPDIHRVVDWVDIHKKIVIVCGLNGTYDRKLFGKYHEILPYADEIILHKSFCSICNEDATFTAKKIEDSICHNRDGILVGGAEKYQPMCRGCYLKYYDLTNSK